LKRFPIPENQAWHRHHLGLDPFLESPGFWLAAAENGFVQSRLADEGHAARSKTGDLPVLLFVIVKTLGHFVSIRIFQNRSDIPGDKPRIAVFVGLDAQLMGLEFKRGQPGE